MGKVKSLPPVISALLAQLMVLGLVTSGIIDEMAVFDLTDTL
jgi:hypothetical protein